MAQIIGQRSTYQTAVTEDRRVRHIDEKIAMLEPDIAPMITLLNAAKKRRAIDSTKHEWMEDDYVARWVKNGSTTVTNSTTNVTITLDDNTLVVPGDILVAPAATSGSIGEYMLVQARSASNVVTVVRNFNGHGIVTLGASTWLRLIGSGFSEGASYPEMKTTSPTTKTTYTQIFKKAINFTNTQIAQRTYGSQADGERKRQQMKGLKEFKEQLNAALLWGKAYEAATGINSTVSTNSNPHRFTMGLNSQITTNVTDANGLLTRRTFESWARQVFRYAMGKELVLLASPIVVSAINQWATSFLQVSPTEKVYGVSVNKVRTGHGDFQLVRDWMLEDAASGATGFSGLAFALDLDQIEYLYLQGNGESRDTRLIENVVQDGSDRKVDLIMAEVGYAIKNEKYHGKLWNVSNYAE